MITIRPAQIALLLLCTATLGCASTKAAPPLVIRGASPEPAFSGLRFHVERNGLSKKVRFRDLDASRMTAMRYKGIPVAWGSPVNLLFDDDVYERESHRVRYRFRHPLTAQPMVLLARAQSNRIATVPVRSGDTLPVVHLYAGDEERPRGTLRYDDRSQILFSGQIEERRIEIERVSEVIPPALNRGLLKHILFPYPEMGEFAIRVDGREAAWFSQYLQEGVISPYDLALEPETDQATREDAMLAFVVFDLMKDFVNGSH